MGRFYVIVSGAPGSGKTTLAVPLAAQLDLPLVRKDTIKEALGETLGAASYEESLRLGRATMQVLRGLMRDVGFGVYESTWRAHLDLAALLDLPRPLVEVFCDCDPALRLERIHGRLGSRHPVHFDLGHLAANAAGDPTARPLAGPWPVLQVDTSAPVPIPELAERVRGAARSPAS